MTSITQISSIAEQVVKNLSRAHSTGELTIITTPILAYGHTFVSVRLTTHGNSVMISDGGFARREVEMLGGETYFAANAYRIAQRYGIQCDGDLFFSIEGHDAIDEITSAVAAVANASKDTIETIAERMADREVAGTREKLFTTLRRSFGNQNVLTGTHARLPGASGEWEFDAVVNLPMRRLAVVLVTPYANSVTTAFSKFSDIKSLRTADRAPDRRAFGVLTDRDKTPRLSLISNVATLVPFEQSTPETWQGFAKAA
jgi:hypothetical protein